MLFLTSDGFLLTFDNQEQRKKKKGLEKLELPFIEFPAAAGEIREEAAASITSGGNSLSLKKK